MINIANFLTLRYDPYLSNTNIRCITQHEIIQNRQRRSITIPTPKEIENTIRRTIREKIENIENYREKRIAIAVSSGIDSNVILSLIRKEFPSIEIDCITVSFEDSLEDEANCTRKIAESQNASFHEVNVENLLTDLPMLLSVIKEPRWNIYQYYYIKKAKTISSILFTGDGGDELFAGYTFRYKKFLDFIKSDYSWIGKVHSYLLCHERDWIPDQEDIFAPKIKFEWLSIYLILKKYFANNLDPFEQILLADYNGKLKYDFMPTTLKFFKFFNINGVTPLLSNELIDLSFQIPAFLKYDVKNNLGKIPLREIIKTNNITYYNIIKNKDTKIGFGMNLSTFWKRIAKEIVTSYLEKARIFEDKIINREWYNKSLIKIRESNNERYINKMLQIFSLEIWYKMFITAEINVNSSI